jgi:hypothetical protein
MMKPRFISVTESPVAPPDMVNPEVDIDVA